MSDLALQLIEKNKLSKVNFLDLGNCSLTELPKQLFDCTWLERLNLGEAYRNEKDENTFPTNDGKDNFLTSFALKGLQQLANLKDLFLRKTGTNELTHLRGFVNL